MKALHWMTAVKNRSTRIANIFQSHVFHMLTQRGFSPMALDVEKSPSSVQICAEICGELSKGILPDLDSVLESLSVKESGWARLMEMVPDKEKPYDWRSFGYLFYVFQILKPALGDYKAASDDRTAGNDSAYQTAVPRLMVGIDDNVERRIYSRAQKFLKALRSSKSGHQPPHYLLEVYMCRRIFIDGNMDGSNLYLSDPSPIRPSLNSCEQRSVHAAYDGIPACHARLSPFDVAERLHNIDDIKVLKKQFSQEGFLCH
ncbi:hypothetical protein BJ878DRAFT_525789 [Calycina marina]|uniref:Uncharacterized protein n=1 Tax=Calycina marina TaxID=1763456 RepID=A0A9P8CB40_9HELO|nr:hypothetical protein BJ878DRAFT_525789 [Calycina marina]